MTARPIQPMRTAIDPNGRCKKCRHPDAHEAQSARCMAIVSVGDKPAGICGCTGASTIPNRRLAKKEQAA